jgi:hypothetical protein
MTADPHNLFLTRTTYRLLRAEYGAALIGQFVLALIHLGRIRWPVFISMFVYIDLIGYCRALSPTARRAAATFGMASMYSTT